LGQESVNEDAYRAHMRRRRRLLVSGGVVFVLVLASLVGFPLLNSAKKPKITYDFMAELNAPIQAVPVEQHAWPRLRDGVLALRRAAHERLTPESAFVPADGASLHAFSDAGELHAGWFGAASTPETYAEEDFSWSSSVDLNSFALTPSIVRAYFLEQQPVLERMREACTMPVLGAPYSLGMLEDPADQAFFYTPSEHAALAAQPPNTSISGQSAVAVGLPHLAELRAMGRLLAADAALATEAGDGSRAVDDLVAMLGLARLAHQDPFLIEQLVATSIQKLAIQELQELLTRMPQAFSGEDLARLAAVLEGPDAEVTPYSLEGERIFFKDFLQRVYSDDGAGNGVLLIGQIDERTSSLGGLPDVVTLIVSPFMSSMAFSRKEAATLHEELIEEYDATTRQPAWAMDMSAFDQTVAKVSPQGSGFFETLSHLPFTLLWSSYKQTINTYLLAAARRDRMRLIVALMRYERDHGAWPEALTQLVPDHLSEVPLDPADGAPLRYDVRGGRPLLWSIGRDRVDDDGRIPVEGTDYQSTLEQDHSFDPDFTNPGLPIVTGDDWILWRGPRTP
jgi:hypothetical protein